MNRRLTLDSKIKLPISTWDFYGFVLLVCVTLLLIPTWPKLPFFMDCYYHLSVMRGFADAGGWTPQAFWEFAPLGRPQLYPPLFHFMELAVFKAGLGPIAIARLFDFFIYPVFLFCLWWPLRRLADNRIAFFSLLLMVSSYPLYLGVLNNIPFSLAFILSFLAYYCLKRGRLFGAGAALVFALYAHTLMSFIGVAAFCGACLFLSKRDRARGLAVAVAALIMACPLLIFQAAHRRFFNFGTSLEFYFVDINICLMLLFFAGLILFLRRKNLDPYFLALLVAMLALWVTNRDRFLSGIGLAPMSIFGAVALDRLWCRIRIFGSQVRHGFFWGIFVTVLFMATPMLRFSPLEKKPRFEWESSLIAMSGLKPYENVKSETLYHSKLYSEAVRLVERGSLPDDIIFSNLEYGGGIIAVLAHRATSFAMLREVKPNGIFDPVAAARYIVWFKNPQGTFSPFLRRAVEGYGLRQTGETELVYLYENPSPTGRRHVVPAVVPEWACFGLMGLLAAIIFFDLLLARKEEKG